MRRSSRPRSRPTCAAAGSTRSRRRAPTSAPPEAGWPQRRIAEAVGCSPRHVSAAPSPAAPARVGAGGDRRRGRCRLSAVPTVETIAAVAPAVADAVAAALATGTLTAAELTEHPEGALAELAQSGDDGERPTLVALPGYQDLGALALDADLAARAEAAGVHGVSFSAEDMDAARAFGCLIEFAGGEDRYWRRGFVADAAWLADRVRPARRARRGARRARRPSVARRHAPRAARRARATRRPPERVRRGAPPPRAPGGHREPARARAWRTSTSGGGRFSPTTSRPRSRCRWRARSCWSPSTTTPRTPPRGFASPTSACSAPRRPPPRRARRASGSTTPSATRPRRRSSSGSRGRARRHSSSGARCRRCVGAFYADQEALPQSERRPADVPGRYGGGIAAGLPALMDALAREVLPERLAARLREPSDAEALAA